MIKKLRPYPKYKDSGVPWLGKVPAHWEVVKLKQVTRKIVDGTHFTPTYVDDGIPFIRVTDIQTDNLNLKNLRKISKTEHKELNRRCKPEKGDLLLSKNGTIGMTKVVDWDFPFSIFVSLCLIKPIPTLLNVYFASLAFKGGILKTQINDITKTTSVTNLHLDKIKELIFFLPPLPEQQAIVRFLDWAERRIRKAIRLRQRRIKLLQEYKQALIHQAVTGKIDVRTGQPYPEYKDSGVEWLGKVPKHWEITRVKTEFDNYDHRRIPLSATERGAMKERIYDYFGASGVIDKVDDYLFDGEYLLLAEDGANLILRNLPLAIVATGKFWVNNHAHILKPKRGNIYFLAQLMESLNYLPWISGAAQPKLTQDRLMNITICIPPPRRTK